MNIPSKSSGNTYSVTVCKPSGGTKTPARPSTTVKQPTNNGGTVDLNYEDFSGVSTTEDPDFQLEAN